MGRPRTIEIDDLDILRGIERVTTATVESLRAESAEFEKRSNEAHGPIRFTWSRHQWVCDEEIKHISQYGVEYDIPAFFGREPSSTERIRIQQAIRRMDDAGDVEIFGKRAARVRITEQGRKRVENGD